MAHSIGSIDDVEVANSDSMRPCPVATAVCKTECTESIQDRISGCNIPMYCMMTYHNHKMRRFGDINKLMTLNDSILSQGKCDSNLISLISIYRPLTDGKDAGLLCTSSHIQYSCSKELHLFTSTLLIEDGIVAPEIFKSDITYVNLQDVEKMEFCVMSKYADSGESFRCSICNIGLVKIHVKAFNGRGGESETLLCDRDTFATFDAIHCRTYDTLSVQVSMQKRHSDNLLIWAPQSKTHVSLPENSQK